MIAFSKSRMLQPDTTLIATILCSCTHKAAAVPLTFDKYLRWRFKQARWTLPMCSYTAACGDRVWRFGWIFSLCQYCNAEGALVAKVLCLHTFEPESGGHPVPCLIHRSTLTCQTCGSPPGHCEQDRQALHALSSMLTVLSR